MAPFLNLDTSYDIEKEPNYLGYSRGVDVPRSLAEANTSLGKLFGNAGEILSDFTRGATANITDKINQDVRNELEPVQREMGGDLPPNQVPDIAGTGARGARYANAVGAGGIGAAGDLTMDPATGLRPLPPDAQAGVDRVQQLKEAYAAGGLSQTMYDSQVQSTVQRMRAKYGDQWAPEIDAAVANINGSAANHLRRQVLTDLISAQTASQAQGNKVLTMMRQDQEYFDLLPESLRPASAADYVKNYDAIQVEIGHIKSEKLDTERQLRSYNLAKAGSEDRQRLGKDIAEKQASNALFTFVNVQGLDKKLSDLTSRLGAEAGKGVNADPKMLAELTTQLDAAEATITGQYRLRIAAQMPDLDSKTVDEIVDKKIHGYFQLFRTAAGTGNIHAANAAASMVTGLKDQAIAKYAQTHAGSVDIALEGISKLNPERAKELYNIRSQTPAGAKEQADTSKWLDTWYAGNLANTSAPPASTPSISEVIKGKQQAGDSSGIGARSTINTAVAMVMDKDNAVAAKAVRSMYGDSRFIAGLSRSERLQMYTMTANPQVTARIAELRKSDPEAAAVYDKYMDSQFAPTFFSELGKAQTGVTGQQFTFDPESWTLRPLPAPEGSSLEGAAVFNAARESQFAGVNQAMALVRPWLEEKYGKDALPQMMQMLQRRGPGGIDFQRQPEDPLGKVLPAIGNAIMKGITPEGVAGLPGASEAVRGVGVAGEGAKNLMAPPAPVPGTSLPPGQLPGQDKQSSVNDTVLSVAQNYLGLSETKDRATLASFIKKGTGKVVDPQVRAWCADFANAVLSESGASGTGSSAARSFLNYGTETKDPQKGDIAVLWRGSKNSELGHVGFVDGFTTHDGEKYVRILAGNQNNAVSISEFPVSRVLGYRRVKPDDVKEFHFSLASNEGFLNPAG